MKRAATVTALILLLGAPGVGRAATLHPADADGLNLRSGPGTGYQIVGTMAASQSAQVLQQQGDWVRVRTSAGQEAWVAGWVSRISYADEDAFAAVNTDELNVRKEPSTTAPVLATITQGQRVRLLESAGIWWRIRTGAGLEGWVASAYMKREAAPAQQAPAPQAPAPQAPAPQAPAPQAPAPQVSAQPPAAPSWAVPTLPERPASPPVAAGKKQVVVLTETGVYQGRDPKAFVQYDTVRPGEAVTYLGAAEGWVKIATPRGEEGWVPGTAVTFREGPLAYEIREGRWTISYLPATGATAAPAAAGPAQTQPQPPAQPAPAQPQATVRRVVQDSDGLRLRATPSLDAAILAVLPKGEVLEVLATQAPWLQVKTASGRTGWVHGDYTAPLPSPAPPTPAPATAPATSTGAPLWRATLEQTAPGVLRLALESATPAVGEPRANENRLWLPLATQSPEAATLPVEALGAHQILVTPDGFLFTFESPPSWQVVERSAGKVVLELRPVLQAVVRQDFPDRVVYTARIEGAVSPRTSIVGDDVVVDLPGAKLASVALLSDALPKGIRVEEQKDGVRLLVGSRQAYALKRLGESYELHLYKPGLTGKVILLDPGHGGDDAGAWNPTYGVREKDSNLGIALRLRAMLEAQGAIVYMTRATDSRSAPPAVMKAGGADRQHADLGYRTRMADELHVDLFLSIHHNAGTGSGTETYYTGSTLNGDRSGAVARALQNKVPGALGQFNRGIRNDLMYVTRNVEAPAALIEVGFITHSIEGELAKRPEYQEMAARAMLEAMIQFYAQR